MPPTRTSHGRSFALLPRLTFGLPISLAFIAVLASCQTAARRDDPAAAQTPAPAVSAQAAPARPSFDGARAFEHVRRVVEIGPRPAGSDELKRAREYVIGELSAAGMKVTTDEFTAQTPQGPRQMVNVTAELPGKSPAVIVVAGHYDTKPVKEFRFVGANDGGSSTGALIELARALKASGREPEFTYWFAFFDGEEAFCKNWNDCSKPGQPDNTYGSRRYVSTVERSRLRALILLDMVGYKNLAIPREGYSTRWLTDIIWETARSLGYGQYFTNSEEFAEDDHFPFLRAGVPSVNLIQLSDYIDAGYWHTEQDTLDKVSPQSLQIVGETVLASLSRIEERLKREPQQPMLVPAR
ncbi:MAG TPA: M28 family peptidase [Pyrinomonadaceae bacterium]|nr:M28 family peptidase [Pyrinomonadaceae bacterium]